QSGTADATQQGVEIRLGRETHFLRARPQQIFDLLISTYEDAVHMTEELRSQQSKTAHSFQSLHGLYKIAEALNPALTEQAVAETALERIRDFPGIAGGFVKAF